MIPQSSNTTVSVTQAAAMIGCSERTVRNLIESGAIEAGRLTPRGWHRISLSSLRAYLAESGTFAMKRT